MSAREIRSNPVVGDGTSYHTVTELIQDKDQIDAFAEALDVSRRNVRKDLCGQWTISGKGGHVQTWGDQSSSYLLYVVAHSARKWGATSARRRRLVGSLPRTATTKDVFGLGLPNEHQSEYSRALLGLRRRRRATAPMSAIGGKADIVAGSQDVRS
jgi:hypothetical protein